MTQVHVSYPCRCCGRPNSGSRTSMLLKDYCDPVCYAAFNTLSRNALSIWRLNCLKVGA
jgi:hypothetical protein